MMKRRRQIHIEMAIKSQCDRRARGGLFAVFSGNDNAVHTAGQCRMRQPYWIAAAHRTASDDACIKPRIGIGTQHGLHEHPQRRGRLIGFDLDCFKMRKEGRARVPWGVGAS